MKSYLVSFVFLFLLFSCDNQKKNYLNQISTLIKTCDSLENTFKKEKNDSIAYYIQNVMDVELRIKKYYKTDTISVDFAKKLNKFKMVRKKLKPLLKKNMYYLTAVYEVKQSLQLLKKDIENNAGERNKYKEYIQFEKKKVDNISFLLNDLLETQKKQIDIFNEYYTELNTFSMNLSKE